MSHGILKRLTCRTNQLTASYLVMIRAVTLVLVLGAVATAGELTRAQQTIRLRGLPNDEIPVVTSVAIHPTEDLLATSGDDHAVRLWNLKTGKLIKTLRAHSDWVTSVLFCEGGSKLLTGGKDQRLLLWDLRQSGLPKSVGRHAHPISRIALHRATDMVAVAGFRAPLKIYDLKNGKLQHTLDCPCNDTRAIAFSPNGNWLGAGARNGKLRLWNLRSGAQFDIEAHKRRITSIVFASNELLISAGEEQRIHVWNVERRARQHSLQHSNGKVLAMTMIDEHRFAAGTAQNTIPLFDIQDTKPYAVLIGHTGSIAALVARERQLYSGSFDTTMRIWDIANDEARNQAAADSVPSASVSQRIDPASPIIE